MNSIVKKLTDRLTELSKIYEEYIWRGNNRKLITIIEDNTIAFYLYDNNEVLDEFILSFDSREEKLYRCISLKVLGILFDNVVIKNNENIYYSNGYKNYLELIVNDENINDLILKLYNNQENEYLDTNNKTLSKVEKETNGKIYSSKFINVIDKRIMLTKKMLRR